MGHGPAHTLLEVKTSLCLEELTVRCDESLVVAVTFFSDFMDCGVLVRVLLESAMAFQG